MYIPYRLNQRNNIVIVGNYLEDSENKNAVRKIQHGSRCDPETRVLEKRNIQSFAEAD